MNNSYDLNKLFDFFEYWKAHTHPTEFYNEGWLLKLLVLAVTDFGLKDNPLYISEKDMFFSEGLLPSPFLTKGKKNPFAESHTHADGVIGDFNIGNDKTKGLLELDGDKLIVFEAKINSEFSKKVTNASFYNQAARYVACITETIDAAEKIKVIDDLSIAFYLAVPEKYYKKKKNFAKLLDKNHISDIVKERVEQYKDETDYEKRKEWLNEKFSLVLEKMTIRPIFYEDVILKLRGYKHIDQIEAYYKLCLDYNV